MLSNVCCKRKRDLFNQRKVFSSDDVKSYIAFVITIKPWNFCSIFAVRLKSTIGRFYARDVKVVKTHLTSETLKWSGIKTGRIKVDKLTDKNKIFLKK